MINYFNFYNTYNIIATVGAYCGNKDRRFIQVFREGILSMILSGKLSRVCREYPAGIEERPSRAKCAVKPCTEMC